MTDPVLRDLLREFAQMSEEHTKLRDEARRAVLRVADEFKTADALENWEAFDKDPMGTAELKFLDQKGRAFGDLMGMRGVLNRLKVVETLMDRNVLQRQQFIAVKARRP